MSRHSDGSGSGSGAGDSVPDPCLYVQPPTPRAWGHSWWDHTEHYSKTVTQNYETMGLLGGNLNVLPRRVPKTDGTQPTPPPLGPESINKPTKKIVFVSGVEARNMPSLREQLDSRACGESSRGAFHMTIDEIAYLEPLIEKYEENWNGMFKDNKLNYKQMTREKLSRRCVRNCSFVRYY